MQRVKMVIIGSKKVGIVGLEEVFKKLQGLDLSEEELRERILEEVQHHNYIPESAIDLYKDALLREFKKFLGEEVEEDIQRDFLDVKVLGVKCAKCDNLEREVRAVLAELDIPAEIEHVSDPKEIARYGIVPTPSLVVNGRIMSKGKVLSKEEIREIILRVL